MNKHLQKILQILNQGESLTEDQKNAALISLKDADKELEIITFKLDRTEKVKRTTAILLEETIEELEQKRKAVEEQNKELELEAALERVRSRTMAMYKSEELGEVVHELFNQMSPLGFAQWGCTILLENKGGFDFWFSPGGKVLECFHVPKIDHPFFEKLWSIYIDQVPFTDIELKDEAKRSWDNAIFEKSDFRKLPEEVKASMVSLTKVRDSIVSMQYGLFVAIDTSEALSQALVVILQRFAKVFEQTYTRFLDLQKAEGQAREAQIQLAMERVRARTMAMQKSDELTQASNLLFQQMQSLEIPAWSAGYCIWDNVDKSSATFWMSSEGILQPPFRLPLTENSVCIRYRQESLRGEEFYAAEYSGEELATMYNYIFQQPDLQWWNKLILEDTDRPTLPTFQINHVVYFAHGFLLFVTHKHVPEVYDIFKRFGKVFEQTYTRFLDLQKAEAQAKESQIQLALERVRARTMAMHHSSELADTATILFQQIKELGYEIWSCGFGIWKPEVDMEEAWMSTGDLLPIILIPFKEDPTHLSIYEASLRGESVYEVEVKGEVLTWHYNWLMSLPSFKIVFSQIENSGAILPTVQWKYAAFFKQGYLHLITTKPQPDIHDISRRFAKVFEQTYTRFLDLQKAEAQAREAQIETALERVRAASMAMHKSEELHFVIRVVYDQLVQLNFKIDNAGFLINPQESDDYNIWSADANGVFPIILHVPYFDHPFNNDYVEHKARGTEHFSTSYPFEIKNEWWKKLWPTMTGIPEEISEALLDIRLSSPGLALSRVLTKNVGLYLLNFSGTPYTETENATLIRFGKAFEQSYIRFLDLQKAEAQAREAQIEAALERVRSRSMGMQKSEELREAIQVIYEQLIHLNINIDFSGFAMDYRLSNDWKLWAADSFLEYPVEMFIPYLDHPQFNRAIEARDNGLDFEVCNLTTEEKNSIWDHIFKYVPTPQESKEVIYGSPGFATSWVLLKNVNLYICNLQGIPYSDADNATLKRFGRVFEQIYTRFNDLKNAEAQAIEAKIEAALERVRARTMAMQRSEELQDAAIILFQQMKALGVQTGSCGFNIWDKDQKAATVWMSSAEGTLQSPFKMPHTESPIYKQVYAAMKNGEAFLVKEVVGKALKKHFDYLSILPGIGDVIKHLRETRYTFPETIIYNFAFFNNGYLSFHLHEHRPETYDIFKRFGKVFEQTYTRFLDLQKAEAQAREAQIEASLERVRFQAMAMQNSEDVSVATATMFLELDKLGVKNKRCGIAVIRPSQTMEVWSISNLAEGKMLKGSGSFDMNSHPLWRLFSKGWEAKEEFLYYYLANKEKEDYVKILNTTPTYLTQPILDFPDMHFHAHYFGEGAVWTFSLQPHVEEDKQVMKRFTSVFSLTFRRYLDLKQAEAQAREAQIETSVERVRSQAMAMRSSEDLIHAAEVMRNEMIALKVEGFTGATFYLVDENDWVSMWDFSDPGNLGNPTSRLARWNPKIYPTLGEFWRIWKEGTPYFVIEYGPDKLKQALDEWYEVDKNIYSVLKQAMDTGQLSIQWNATGSLSRGVLSLDLLKPPTEDTKQIVMKMTAAFDLAYQRFEDLSQAEAQAREAQIEASLERVRGKAMAMHSSEDLTATISIFYHELELFSITPRRCGVGLIDKETRMVELSTMNTTGQGKSIEVIGRLKLVGHSILEGIYDNWLLQNEYHPVLRDIEIKEYYQLIRPQVDFPVNYNDAVQYGYFFFFAEGGVYAWTEKELIEDELKIYRRFTTVLSLTYKRYKDLRESEAREKEAIKQAALDRVRADIASMRSTADLDRITPLIWKELTTLGIPLIRCGVFIMDEEENKVHTYLSTPDGRAIAAYHTPMDNSGGLAGAIDRWRLQEVFVTHWIESDFQIQADILLKQGSITTREQYLNTLPKDGFHLHFLPFRQGMLYVGSINPLPSDALQLVRSLADAFSVAYARYEDFTKLESAKQQIENTLTDLKQTQTQLIQSEKMASLGELTAGIAHEIQNPLNFVNNFSELSVELAKELKEEAEKPEMDKQIILDLAKDLSQNQEKIHHHGIRASNIVKGMLEHSRKNSGEKEPTDINALADEYLRLAYHGLRAKDKDFNAVLETDFDATLPKVNVVSQDIGRVMLNLITNALYAVNERSKKGEAGYEPKVTVTTQVAANSQLLIVIKDNGNGIPESILDKIFLPFFTTKPTGQGTGLGLSLAYDIVIAQGGELKVESIENEGAKFIILLANVDYETS